jgi:hypothetical protein
MRIVLKLKNDLGEFISETLNVSEEQYLHLIEISKNFYNQSGYETGH